MEEWKMTWKWIYDSPLGPITLASDGDSLVGLWLEGQKYFASTVKDGMEEREDLPVFALVHRWLDDYFAGKRPSPDQLPLAPRGSEFRQKVWQILCRIPYGETMTYGQIARELSWEGKGMPAQAVGGAVGHNPISIIIPCHRVVGTSGSLTGYAGGVDKKAWLLTHEGVDLSRFTIPTKGTAI